MAGAWEKSSYKELACLGLLQKDAQKLMQVSGRQIWGYKIREKNPEIFKYRNNCLLKQNPPQAVIFQVKLGTPLSVICDWGK